MNELRANHLSKSFRLSKREMLSRKVNTPFLVAVKDFSISLNAGEIYGLLGPNGAGKTTSLRMLSSLLSPDSGEILFHDEDVKKNLEGYRKKVGFLTSELKLDDFYTPNYTFSYMARLYGLSEEEIAANKKKLFDRFGVHTFADTKISALSTGMKQKVSLAVSLCHEPEIIIFDEPTNGLDILASREVENALLTLREENKVIVISTHIFSLVEKLCDRVGILLDGVLQEEGYMKDLCAEKSLEDVFFTFYKEKIQ